jgi:hypothetical protein
MYYNVGDTSMYDRKTPRLALGNWISLRFAKLAARLRPENEAHSRPWWIFTTAHIGFVSRIQLPSA